MEMKTILVIILSVTMISSCQNTHFRINEIEDVYVDDFNSEDIESCKPSDVDLSHSEAREYFMRSKLVDYKIIHDHYNNAPCYIEGTLKYNSMICNWEIRAGATGQIQCGQNTYYFACDACEALFQSDFSAL